MDLSNQAFAPNTYLKSWDGFQFILSDFYDYVSISDSLIYIPTGLLGAILGTFLLKKISSVWLNRIFGAFMIYAGIRLLLK